MSKILYVKADAKPAEESRTFKISDCFIEEYKKLHPSDEVVLLDLYKEEIAPLPYGKINELHTPADGAGHNHPILKYAYQFLEADKFVIAAPFWNLSIPAILKAYIDYITVTGITFKYTANGPVGLCTGKKVVHITSRGGVYSAEPMSSYEMGDRYLRTILGFLGVTDFTTIAADGLDVVGNDVNAILNDSITSAKEIVKGF